jgi:hypothetical protein
VFASDAEAANTILRVYEVSPTHDQVVPVATATTQGAGGPMVLAGDILFIGGIDGDVAVHSFDVSDPTAPVELDRTDLPDTFDGASSLVRVGAYLYVTDGASSVLVMNVADPSNMEIVEVLAADSDSRLILDFPSLYVTESGVYDVADPGAPRLERPHADVFPDPFSGDQGVAVGNNLYILGLSGIDVLEIADLTTEAGSISFIGEDTDALHISYVPGHLVLGVRDPSTADESGLPTSGLRIYSIEDPLNPLLVQYDPTRGTVYAFDVQAGHAAAIGGTGSPTDLLIYRLE